MGDKSGYTSKPVVKANSIESWFEDIEEWMVKNYDEDGGKWELDFEELSWLASAMKQAIKEGRSQAEEIERLRRAGPGLGALRRVNAERAELWRRGQDPASLSFAAMELAGEAGEACDAAKKIERARLGYTGGDDSPEAVAHLADELADVVICADLVAMGEGIDLAEAVERKFNATSEKHGFDVRI